MKVFVIRSRLTGHAVFRPGGDIDGAAELEKFLNLSKEKGYAFKSIDTYLTDN